MRPHRCVPAAGLVVLLSAGVAQAEATAADKAAAVLLFDNAERAMAEGHFSEACPKYAESNRLDPQIGALIHLANCYEKAGQTASAWESWRDAADLSSRRGDPRESDARERANALESTLARVTITVPHDIPGLEVRRDDQVLGRALWDTPLPVDAGPHTFEARAPGQKTWTVTVQLADADNKSVEVPVLEAAPANTAGPTSAATGNNGASTATSDMGPTGSRGSTQRLLGFVAGGVGIVGLALGGVFALQKSSRLDERNAICPTQKNCTPGDKIRDGQLTDQANSAGTLSTVSLIAGGALLAGGIVLVVTAPSGSGRAAKIEITPIVASDGWALAAHGIW